MYRVQLQNFEGPLDLLLFFIRRDELDIHDIPVARITDEYLAYVRVLEEVDLDGVADFIYMAAILIGIKAKMLLPRPELDDEGEPVDPRAELVRRLLEYMRYKEAASHLEQRFEQRGEQYVRGAASDVRTELSDTVETSYRVSVFDLISVLKRVLAEAPAEAYVHPVQRYDYTVEEQQAYVLRRVRDGRTSFVSLVAQHPKPFVITTFLAILELVQRHEIRIVDGVSSEDFWLAAGERPPVHESLGAAVHALKELHDG
ncbi:MAG: segregation/condensation protein A [Rhodothermales bacterium]